MYRAVAVSVLAVCAGRAGVVQMWPIDELAKAPMIAVARVEKITAGAAVPAGKPPWRTATRTCTATLKVLRAWPDGGAAARPLDFYCYGPPVTHLMAPPIFPNLRAGATYVLPLQRDGERWRLIHEQGMGLVIPAIARPLGHEPYASARDALIRELVNTLVQGEYSEIARLSQSLGLPHGRELGAEIAKHLDDKLSPTDGRWLDIATALMGSMGIPRPGLELMISNPPAMSLTASLVSHALRRVPPERRRDGIIRNALEQSAVHPWGTAATLVPEFKDDPLLLELLPAYLERGHAGAISVAASLVHDGQMALAPLSVDAALRLLRDGEGNVTDLHAACLLVARYGAEDDFDQYVALMVKAKTSDLTRYNQLWQVAYELPRPRNLRLIEVWLADERVMSGRMRYCDIAGGVLQRAANENFGFTTVWDSPLDDRQAALLKARAWMARNRPATAAR